VVDVTDQRVLAIQVNRQIWHYATSDGVPTRSLMVAVVVGTIVNVINQGDALLGHRALSVVKLLMTYVVSYLVGTYGAVSYRLHSERQPRDGATQGS
jgi:hypothetical protein